MVTRDGTVKKTELSAFEHVRATGIRAVTLDEEDTLVSVRITSGNDEIVLATASGKSIRFNESNVRAMGRSARGVRGIELDSKDFIVTAEIMKSECSLLVVTEKGYGKRSDPDEYRLQSRGGRGVKTVKISEKNGHVVGLLCASQESDIMLTTNTGRVLRIPASSLRVMGRVTQGVCLMRILEDEKVVSFSLPSEFDDTPTTTLENVEEEQ